MDPLIITAIIAAFGSLAVSILTHIKHCKSGCLDITTTESNTSIQPKTNTGLLK